MSRREIPYPETDRTTPRINWINVVEVGHFDWYDGPLSGVAIYNNIPCWYYLSGGDTNSIEHSLVEITEKDVSDFVKWQALIAVREATTEQQRLDWKDDPAGKYQGPELDFSKKVAWIREEWGNPEIIPTDVKWTSEGF